MSWSVLDVEKIKSSHRGREVGSESSGIYPGNSSQPEPSESRSALGIRGGIKKYVPMRAVMKQDIKDTTTDEKRVSCSPELQ